jgi:hypothetical protein
MGYLNRPIRTYVRAGYYIYWLSREAAEKNSVVI